MSGKVATLAVLLWAAAGLVPAWAQDKPGPDDVSERLEAARERLEAAAREVAQLSLQAGEAPEILAFGGVEPGPRAIIGVQLDPEPVEAGARVLRVSPGGPAAEAGIAAGDVITSIDGQSLRGLDRGGRALVERMRDVRAEQKLKLAVEREGKSRSVELKARAAPVRRAMALPPLPPMPPLPPGASEGDRLFVWQGQPDLAIAGLELATLTARLGRYFGAERGALVLRAPRDAAWQLEDGDVLLAIDGREPTSAQHATRILRSYQGGEALQLRVLRDRRMLQLSVKLPKSDRKDTAAGAVRMRPRAAD
jgi:S1-C subfamily serine protease